LVFFNEDSEDDYFKMMKNSFKLPMIKKEIFNIMNIKYESKFLKMKDVDMDGFKKIVSDTKIQKKHILILFQDDKVNYFLKKI